MNIHFTRLLTLVLVVIPCLILGAPPNSQAQVGVMITVGPPPLPIYEQPVCPGDGYIWTPGYWAYGDDFDDYYWVPGTWILAPEVGFFWTPGYWSWGGDRFVFYDGYWGPQVGFYGGVNYGFGYFGDGYEGGRWDNGHFFYNRSVNNVNVSEIHNVYNTTVNNPTESRVSFNGGNGGITARPTPQQQATARERHIPPVVAQTQQMQAARGDQQLRASVNRGKPYVAATARPGDFKGSVVPAKEAGGAYNPPNRGVSRGANQPVGNSDNRQETGGSENPSQANSVGHVRDLPPAEKPAAPNTGDPKTDKKYQQEQDKQFAQQQEERQKLAQQQEKEDATVANQQANDAQKQQVEQRHQQQTQELQQRHQQQQQQMQQRMQPPPRAPERSLPPK